MKRHFMSVCRMASVGAVMLSAFGCGTADEQDDREEEASAINVGTTSTSRVVPSSGPTSLGKYPSDTGGNFEVYTASDQFQTRFIIQFVNLQSVPVNVCGAFTCNGSKATFALTSPPNAPNPGIGVVDLIVNGNRCLAGSRFQMAYAASKSAIPSATCTATRSRI